MTRVIELASDPARPEKSTRRKVNPNKVDWLKGMEREPRISAGGIVIEDHRILLVRYCDRPDGNSYLVAPGGAALIDERLDTAAVREVEEETGLIVAPRRILFVEDLLSKRHRITKVWFLCDAIGGQLQPTPGALEEGITEVGWFRRQQLVREVVYPRVLLDYNWGSFSAPAWEARYIEMSQADF